MSSDALNFNKKGVYPLYNQEDRMEIIKSIRYVYDTFLEESLEKKQSILKNIMQTF